MRTPAPATAPRGAAGGEAEAALTSRTAYGEIKAPGQVDTLRDEACPVCGEQDAWDGAECSVCGFVAPPSKFGDPDVDMHKQLDLRQDQAPDGMDVGKLNADVNDADGDGFDDNTGEPVDDEQAGSLDQQPLLECPVCGYQAEAAHPTSISTADPQAGSDASAEGSPDGPAEGDLCPACGQGLMESGTQIAGEGLDPEADPNADVDDDAVVEEGRDPDAPSGPDDLDEDSTRDAQDPEVDDGEQDPEIDPDRLPMDAADEDDPDEDENAGDEEDEDDDKDVKKSFPFGKK